MSVIGHNSRIAELETEVQVLRNERDFYKTKVDRIGTIMAYGPIASHTKCVGVNLVLAANAQGEAKIAQRQLLTASAVRDRRTFKRSMADLEKIRLISESIREDGKASIYTLLPENELQRVVEEWRSKRESVSVISAWDADAMHKDSAEHAISAPKPLTSHADRKYTETAWDADMKHTDAPKPLTSHADAMYAPQNPLFMEESSSFKKDILSQDVYYGDRASEREIAPGLFLNCNTIRNGNLGWTIDLIAVDMTAGLVGADTRKARTVAEIIARDWTANKFRAQNPMAMIKKAILTGNLDEQISKAKLAKATAPYPRGGYGKPKPTTTAEQLRQLNMLAGEPE